jgi:SM-20-related protein
MESQPDGSAAMTIPVLEMVGFLDAVERATILRALESSPSAPAPVYGTGQTGHVDERTRRVTTMTAPSDVERLVAAHLDTCRDAIGAHFGRILTSCEPLQFLRYREGDCFVAHQDGNTPMIRDSTIERKVSVVIFLNEPSDYEGGALLLHGKYPNWTDRRAAASDAGTLVAFPSETTHEVTPVTRGERWTVVSWFRGP